MQQLTARDYVKIKQAIIGYKNLSKSERKEVAYKADYAWDYVFREYLALCLNDEKWKKLRADIMDYEQVTRFNITEHFQSYRDTINADDPEFAEHIYDYDPILHKQSMEIYNNINSYRNEINGKIGKLDSKRFAVGKKLRIKHLENKLSAMERIASDYAELKAKDAKKEDYLFTKSEEYQNNKTLLDAISTTHAQEVVYKALKKEPCIACVKRTNHISYSRYDVDCDTLNRVCNDVRLKALGISFNDTTERHDENDLLI